MGGRARPLGVKARRNIQGFHNDGAERDSSRINVNQTTGLSRKGGGMTDGPL